MLPCWASCCIQMCLSKCVLEAATSAQINLNDHFWLADATARTAGCGRSVASEHNANTSEPSAAKRGQAHKKGLVSVGQL